MIQMFKNFGGNIAVLNGHEKMNLMHAAAQGDSPKAIAYLNKHGV